MGEVTQNKEGWKGKILSGLFWRFLEQISYQGIQLIFSLFLLRILDTEEVGAVSVISIFYYHCQYLYSIRFFSGTDAEKRNQRGRLFFGVLSDLGLIRRNLSFVLWHQSLCGGVLSSPDFRVSFTANEYFAFSRCSHFHPNGLCRKGFAISTDFF